MKASLRRRAEVEELCPMDVTPEGSQGANPRRGRERRLKRSGSPPPGAGWASTQVLPLLWTQGLAWHRELGRWPPSLLLLAGSRAAGDAEIQA